MRVDLRPEFSPATGDLVWWASSPDMPGWSTVSATERGLRLAAADHIGPIEIEWRYPLDDLPRT